MKTLFGYQEQIVKQALTQPFFLNGSEMGTGKTLTTLAEIRAWRPAGQKFRALVVTLNAAKSIWKDEIADVFPDVPCVVLNAKNRPASLREYAEEGWGFLVVHWDVVSSRAKAQPDGAVRDVPIIPELFATEWDFLVADEVHAIKNRNAKRTKAMKKIRARYKRGLSGTPIVNRPDEAWSLLHWGLPKQFSSYWRFFEEHVLWHEDVWGYKHIVGVKDAEIFRERIAPFSCFIQKRDVLPDLIQIPPQYVRLKLGGEQKRAYAEMQKNDLAWIGEFPAADPVPAPTALARLTRLRQFCTAYAVLDHDTGKVTLSEPSSKLDALVDIIESTDKKIVVWTNFSQVVDLVEARLTRLGIGVVSYHGSMSTERRDAAKSSFITDASVRVFVATMQSGGTGMDGLQHVCSTQVFFDRSWSPKDNKQANDRLHRMGQTEPVTTIILQAEDTVDEVVEDALVLKGKWIASMLRGEPGEPG